jgi:hypothetical protein
MSTVWTLLISKRKPDVRIRGLTRLGNVLVPP